MKRRLYCPKCGSRRIGKRNGKVVFTPQSAEDKAEHIGRLVRRLSDAQQQGDPQRVNVITKSLEKQQKELVQQMQQAIHYIEYICGDCGIVEQYYDSPAGLTEHGECLGIEWLNVDDGPYR